MSGQSSLLSLGAARISLPLRIPAPQLLLPNFISPPSPPSLFAALYRYSGLASCSLWAYKGVLGQTSFQGSPGLPLGAVDKGAILTFEVGRGGGLLIKLT